MINVILIMDSFRNVAFLFPTEKGLSLVYVKAISIIGSKSVFYRQIKFI